MTHWRKKDINDDNNTRDVDGRGLDDGGPVDLDREGVPPGGCSPHDERLRRWGDPESEADLYVRDQIPRPHGAALIGLAIAVALAVALIVVGLR